MKRKLFGKKLMILIFLMAKYSINYIWFKELPMVRASFIDVTINVPFIDEILFDETLVERSILQKWWWIPLHDSRAPHNQFSQFLPQNKLSKSFMMRIVRLQLKMNCTGANCNRNYPKWRWERTTTGNVDMFVVFLHRLFIGYNERKGYEHELMQNYLSNKHILLLLLCVAIPFVS